MVYFWTELLVYFSIEINNQKQLLPLTKNWAVAELQISYKQKNRTGIFVNSGDMAYRVLRHMWDKSLINIQEQFCVLFLNHNLEVLGFRVINTGTSTSCTVDINLIISCALLCRANRVILAHNHPSGSLKHSKGDFDLYGLMSDIQNEVLSLKTKRIARLMFSVSWNYTRLDLFVLRSIKARIYEW